MKWKFKDKELKKVLDNLTIIVDSRENANSHIIDVFKKKKIPIYRQAVYGYFTFTFKRKLSV